MSVAAMTRCVHVSLVGHRYRFKPRHPRRCRATAETPAGGLCGKHRDDTLVMICRGLVWVAAGFDPRDLSTSVGGWMSPSVLSLAARIGEGPATVAWKSFGPNVVDVETSIVDGLPDWMSQPAPERAELIGRRQ